MIARLILAGFALLLCAASPQQRALLLASKPGPSLSCDFIATPAVTAGTIAAGPKCPAITFTRADCNPTGACATYFDAAGALQTAATNVARIGYDPVTHVSRGLLIEEARTNSIRNSTMVGAVVGTPGTAPTNWGLIDGMAAPVSGISAAISGVGTETGINYIDIHYTGTASASASLFARAEASNQIPATVGQTVTHSGFVRLAAGSLGTAFLRQFSGERNAAGASLLFVFSPNLTVTGASLAAQRQAFTSTMTQATAAFVLPALVVDVVNGGVYDFTIRWGLPQLEQGAFVTSAVPTTTAAATRAADVASMPTGPWFNAAQGTLAVEYQVPQASIPALNPGPIEIDDGTTANLIGVRQNTPNTTLISGYIANASQGGMTFVTSWAANTPSRVGFTYNGTAITTSINGAATTGGSFSALPTGLTRVSFGTVRGGTINGTISRVRYWNRAQAGGELQGNTR